MFPVGQIYYSSVDLSYFVEEIPEKISALNILSTMTMFLFAFLKLFKCYRFHVHLNVMLIDTP
jgi:hypothetical protein